MYKLKPIKIDDVINNEYAKLFKFLFNKNFGDVNKISTEAKVLYSFFKERTKLSIENKWINNVGEVYIIFTIEEIEGLLNCGKNKAIKAKKELLDIGLIKEKRQGLNKPNLIYIYDLDVTSTINTGSLKNKNQEDLKNKLPKVLKVNPIKNNYIKTNYIKTSSLQKNDDESFINNFIKEFKNKYNITFTKKRLQDLNIKFGEDNIKHYLDNFDKFIQASPTPINNKASYFYNTVLEQYPVPEINKNNRPNKKASQENNYSQRQYSNEYLESLYENI
jgi:hypothetical protein